MQCIEVVYKKQVKLRMTLPRDVGSASPTAPTAELSIVQLDLHYPLSLILHIFLLLLFDKKQLQL